MASTPPPPADVPRFHVRRGRVVALGGAVALTVTMALTSLVLPDRDASAAGPKTGAAIVAAVSPSVSGATTWPTAAATTAPTGAPAPAPGAAANAVPAAPGDSGTGRRIVFDQSDQRVWLIDADESVDRSYLVSGSRFDNLKPGTYSVQSRQRHATSFDHTGTMEYFVRFATGFSEPIGFHAIPVYNDGRAEQTVKQLGTALSAGCVRQKKSDAKYLWDWAPDGTTVVVTA